MAGYGQMAQCTQELGLWLAGQTFQGVKGHSRSRAFSLPLSWAPRCPDMRPASLGRDMGRKA